MIRRAEIRMCPTVTHAPPRRRIGLARGAASCMMACVTFVSFINFGRAGKGKFFLHGSRTFEPSEQSRRFAGPIGGPANVALDALRRGSPPYARTRKGNHKHEARRRRIARQGQDHRKISGPGLPRARLLRPCPRSAAQGRLGRSRRRLRDDLGNLCRQGAAIEGDRRRGEGRRIPDPRHRPRPRGRGDQLARPGGAGEEEGAARPCRAGDVQRHHQIRGAGGDGASARPRRGSDRRLSGAARARLSGRLHLVAGAVAQAAGREVGGAGAVGGAAADRRPRARDRAVPRPGILERHRDAGGGRDGVFRAPGPLQWRQDRPADDRRRGRRAGREEGGRGGAVQRRLGRDQAADAQPAAALHHLDAAAGGGAQAGLLGQPDHAGRAEPLRGRIDHLYAHRRRADGARGDLGGAARGRRPLRRRLRARQAAPSTRPRPRMRRKRTRRSGRPISAATAPDRAIMRACTS